MNAIDTDLTILISILGGITLMNFLLAAATYKFSGNVLKSFDELKRVMQRNNDDSE